MLPLHPRINLKRTQRPRLCRFEWWGPCVRRAVFPIRLSSLPSRSLSGAASRVCESRSTRAATAISHVPFPISHFRQHDSMAHGEHAAQPKPEGSSRLRMRVWMCLLPKDGTRPPICILSLAILIPFGPCHLQHRLLQRTGASSRGTLQARTGSRSLPSGDFEIQERTFISSRPTTPIATPRGETMSEIRTMWRLLPC